MRCDAFTPPFRSNGVLRLPTKVSMNIRHVRMASALRASIFFAGCACVPHVAFAEQCSSVASCVMYSNQSTGSALRASSTGGSAVIGVSSASVDAHANRLVAGVRGISSYTGSNNTAGVVGEAAGSSGYGVYGNGSDGVVGLGTIFGVVGQTRMQTGMAAGILGLGPIGMYGVGFQPGEVGVLGINEDTTNANSVGVVGSSAQIGVLGSGSVGVVAQATTTGAVAFQAEGNGGVVMRGVSGNSASIMSLDDSGNMILAGTMTQSGTPLSRVGRPSGDARIAYGERSSRAVLEDVGEATLSGGAASVAIDPTFARTINSAVRYVVFITPEGETAHPLYVRDRSMRGFTVVEAGGGRETTPFAYRIVATPIDGDGTRLPAASALPHLETQSILRHHVAAPPKIVSAR